MAGILPLTILLALYAVSEIISRKTHALVNTVLTISVFALLGFWTHLLPKDLFTNSGVEAFGMAIVGIMLTALGTTINLAELKRQAKIVLIAIGGALGACALIVLVASLLNRQNYGIVGAPIFAGGNAATLVLLAALKEANLPLLATYALAVLTFQNFIGIPVASAALKKEAQRLLTSGELTVTAASVEPGTTPSRKPLQLPAQFNTPVFCLAKLGAVASLSYGTSLLLHGKINYLVICFVFGILFYQLGFLDDDMLNKTGSHGLITFLVTVVILGSLANTTPQMVISVLGPLLVCLLVGTIGLILTAGLLSKLTHTSFPLTIALGMTCTFGFPTTMLLAQEVAASTGQTPAERGALEQYLLPKMLTAGLVTVTLVSVFFAGFAINYLH